MHARNLGFAWLKEGHLPLDKVRAPGPPEEKKVLIGLVDQGEDGDDDDCDDGDSRQRENLREAEVEEAEARATGAGSAPAEEDESDDALAARLQAEEDAILSQEEWNRCEDSDLKLARELERHARARCQEQLPRSNWVPERGGLMHPRQLVHKPSGSGAASSAPPMDLTCEDHDESSPFQLAGSGSGVSSVSSSPAGDDSESPVAKRRKVDMQFQQARPALVDPDDPEEEMNSERVPQTVYRLPLVDPLSMSVPCLQVKQMHKAINLEVKEIPPPSDLTIDLMPHQKKGVSWMVAQEASKYKGGKRHEARLLCLHASSPGCCGLQACLLMRWVSARWGVRVCVHCQNRCLFVLGRRSSRSHSCCKTARAIRSGRRR